MDLVPFAEIVEHLKEHCLLFVYKAGGPFLGDKSFAHRGKWACEVGCFHRSTSNAH